MGFGNSDPFSSSWVSHRLIWTQCSHTLCKWLHIYDQLKRPRNTRISQVFHALTLSPHKNHYTLSWGGRRKEAWVYVFTRIFSWLHLIIGEVGLCTTFLNVHHSPSHHIHLSFPNYCLSTANSGSIPFLLSYSNLIPRRTQGKQSFPSFCEQSKPNLWKNRKNSDRRRREGRRTVSAPNELTDPTSLAASWSLF